MSYIRGNMQSEQIQIRVIQQQDALLLATIAFSIRMQMRGVAKAIVHLFHFFCPGRIFPELAER